jgi:integrase
MSRRIVSLPGAPPEIRQRGSVYQKGRKQSDAWVPAERAYGYFRVDVPGQSKQKEVRVALGYCRDWMSAMLKLRDQMQLAGVLNVDKIRERIASPTTFEQQAAWMLAEMKTGRIVSLKTGKQIRPRTIDIYQTAINYLNGKIGKEPLASLDNMEAKALVGQMKSDMAINKTKRRLSDKSLGEYFKVFQRVIASATDEKLKQVHPRDWQLRAIGVPVVSERQQHRPVFTRDEITHIVANAKGRYKVAFALLAGSGIRVSELLALEVGKHISGDCTVLYIRQQRGKVGEVELTPKTDAGFRDVDLHSSLAILLREYIGDRNRGFLFSTKNGTMLEPGNLFRHGLSTILKKVGRSRVRFHAFRRFREAVLQRSECRELLINYWMGHADREMSSRYGKQLTEDVEFRREWAEKVGIGFDPPNVSASVPSVVAIRAIRNQEGTAAA